MAQTPPCPTCGEKVSSFEVEQTDRPWGFDGNYRVLEPPQMWVKPCGHFIRGYVANEAGYVTEWRV